VTCKWTAKQAPLDLDGLPTGTLPQLGVHGTLPTSIVCIAKSEGILCLNDADDDPSLAETHIATPCLYVAPIWGKYSYANSYAVYCRLMQNQDSSKNELEAEVRKQRYAATCKFFLMLDCYGPKLQSSSKAQRKGNEACYEGHRTQITELRITIGNEIENDTVGARIVPIAYNANFICYTNGSDRHRFVNDSAWIVKHGVYTRNTTTTWSAEAARVRLIDYA
jgi:hypothetical protein